MAKYNYYLDTRGHKEGTACPLLLTLSHHGTRTTFNIGVSLLPEEWDGERVVKRKDADRLNGVVQRYKTNLENYVYGLALTGQVHAMSAKEIKDSFMANLGVETKERKRKRITFEERIKAYADGCKTESTKTLYLVTLQKLQQYDDNFCDRTFEEMDAKWLKGFETWMEKDLMRNSISIHLRNIRAVFNEALDDEVTTAYPFRKFRIRNQATKDRSLTAKELRQVFTCQCEEWQQEYVDIFKLIFLLCGINIGDLCHLDKIHSGRIEYDRLKTHKHYSIKVEPEALEIINKYKGEKQLLSMLDRYKNHKDYTAHMNDALKKLGMSCKPGTKATGTPLFPDLSTYYARYSWASIAAELDVPRETIAAALGHTIMDVTAVYIRTDMKRKIDQANRKVIDYILYNKKRKK